MVAQDFDRIFALAALVLVKLVKYPAFTLSIALDMPPLEFGEPFNFQFIAHVHAHRFPVSVFHELTNRFASCQAFLPGVF